MIAARALPWIAALVAATALPVAVCLVLAQEGGENRPRKPLPEYRVKAAFLRNFAQYIKWPEKTFETPTAPFVIGIFGMDPFESEIDSEVEGRTSHGRPIEVRRVSLPDEARQCQIVFISRSERHRQAAILEALRHAPILTVGESDWFLIEGGGIRLSVGKNRRGQAKTQFEVNLVVLREEGLTASSRMLDLAKQVIR